MRPCPELQLARSMQHQMLPDELPLPDYDPARIRPCDMWSSAEAQAMVFQRPVMLRASGSYEP